ncbi:H+-transporting two-sector ATPase, delta (OSCP) subunit [Plesiocystis pacifica SIR-1]|uniref:ATP synthase subunit delta n=1 Tax=Plesiocystis pacifica SIR-1 TaxID=391625 RepID=A6G265_9BACT|nr:ATP synthase F1 subunit delta [Plesiocystis pacifica]EDM80034.1 H+-transporting two-sector ATPase, delta (OSCP) subunit [Plesiocystis pacifica SIR-1]
MINGSLAKRYARALMSLAPNAATRDRYLATLGDFTTACKTHDDADPSGESDLINVLDAGHHTLANRRAILHAVLRKVGADPNMVKFFDLVLERGRISGTEQIFLHYRDLADEAAGRIRATVKTASALDPSSTTRIKGALEQATGKTVLLETKVDPELIGGLVAHVGSYTLDRSVRTSLDKLRSSLRS